MADSPLLEALKMKKEGASISTPEDLLTFILSKFDLVPKDDETNEPDDSEQEGPQDVRTQESHTP